MLADANLRDSGQAALVTDGNLDDRKAQPGCPEEQVEIAKRIELAEVLPTRFDPLVVRLEEDLGPAQRVSNRLLEQACGALTEAPVADVVHELHRPVFNRIDKAGPPSQATLSPGAR